MMNDVHTRWTDQISEYLDGTLSDGERRELEAHLAGCPECATVLAEMEEVVRRAGTLGEVLPSRDLWPDIAKVLNAAPSERGPDVIPLPTGRARGQERAAGLYLTRRQLAAAAAVVALVSATATWTLGAGVAVRNVGHPSASPTAVTPVSNVQGPPQPLADELSHLEAALNSARSQLDPATVRILEKNLDVIDRAIQDSRRALVTDPTNPFLKEHLDDAYRQKVAYLREATTIAGWSG